MKQKTKYVYISMIILITSILLFLLLFYPNSKNNHETTLSRPSHETFDFDFKLIDQNNQSLSRRDIKKPYVIFFGFTFCPDICPATLSRITRIIQDGLGEQKNAIDFYFITLDPKRDTADQLKTYSSLFHPNIRYLTGPSDEIDQVIQSFKVFRQLSGDETGDDYMVDHSDYLYYFDASHKFIKLFGGSDSIEDISRFLKDSLE